MRTTLLALVIIALTATAIPAETEIGFSGQVRVRPEIDGRRFVPGAHVQQVTYLRTRAALKALIDGNTEVFVQLQDSRTFGDLTLNGEASSGTLNNTENIDLHQGYIAVQRMFLDGLGMKAGRFEFNLGNQRVFGAVGWSNVGRAWDGIQFWYETESLRVLPFWLKRVEQNARNGNRDFDLYGTNVELKQAGAELFGVYERNADGFFIDGDFFNQLDRISFGGYIARNFEPADIIANAVYQTGTIVNGAVPQERDLSAFLITAEVGYSFKDMALKRIAAGIDFASGDNNTADDEWRAYDNMYYTGHKFRGYMDYFVSFDQFAANISNAGLIDLMARIAIDPYPKWTVKADFHYFRTHEDYFIPGTILETSSDVGLEFDLTVATSMVDGVNLQGGAAIFFASEDVTGLSDPDPGLWLYGMATADF